MRRKISLSEKIKITVVTDDDKQNNAGEEGKPKRILLTQDPFMTLLSVLRENSLLTDSLCGGRGECGGCVVQFLNGATIPTAMERKRFSPEELRQGYRLACMAKPQTDCVVRLPHREGAKVPVLTKTIPLSENIDQIGQENFQSENRISYDTESDELQKNAAKKCVKSAGVISESQPNVMESAENGGKIRGVISEGQSDVTDCMIAVDLGTTTIAMQLMSLATGEVLDTYCEHNPQRHYGADVLSRIQASCTGHREELQRLVCESLLRGVRRFLVSVGAAHLRGMCIAGNTAMEHLLMGYDVQSLGRSPFTPVEIGVQETTSTDLFACLAAAERQQVLSVAADAPDSPSDSVAALKTMPVYLTPGISAFVGGDIVAGLYALRMLPAIADAGCGVHFLVDLGTNGEIAVTDGRRILVTATAAGPAFEGGAESALFGTDRIALAASFLRRGILDETGLLAEPYFSEGVPVETGRVPMFVQSGQTCRIQKEDIRALQMAKAAIRAGIEILWEEMGRPRVAQLYLAGGFGYELDAEAAFAIGLLPAKLRGRVQAVGNTSLAGAFLMGRALLTGGLDRKALEEALSAKTVTESINLAKRKDFAELYLRYMNLEEN